MSETLCVVDPCVIPKRHDTGCDDPACKGCLPGLAADGLLVCSWHHRQGLRILRELPGLDDDLGKALVPVTSGVHPWSSVTRDPGIDLDQNVIDARDYLRGRLHELVAYVVVERGLTLRPAGTVLAMTGFLARHADWMSANRVLAGRWTRQLENLRREANRRAYRTRPTMKLGNCPLTKDDGSVCGTAVRHEPSDYAGDSNIVCRGCGTVGTVDWWQTTIWGDDALLTDDAVARLLSARYARPIPASTVRAWASKGIISKHKVNTRTLFDIAEVRGHADTIWQPVPTGRTA